MNPLWWVLAILLCASAVGAVVFLLMRSRMQVELSKQREELAGTRARLLAEKEALEGSLKNVEEATRRVAMDQFLADIRIEERHYVREHKILFMNRKLLVRQERIFFRNIPLSSWIEHEMPLEEGADAEKMAQTMSVFANSLLEGPGLPIKRLLH